jgi:hypothetical protein
MIENEGRGKLEEKRVTDLIRERGERFHRRGRKPKSPESQRLPKNALRLLRHLLKVTSKEDPIWSESVEEVAKGLGIDPSTVKRLRRRFCEVGVWGRKKERAAGENLRNTRWIWRRPKPWSGKGSGGGEKRWRKRGAKTGAGTKTSAGNSRTQTPFSSRSGRTRAAQTAHSGGGRPALPCHSFTSGKRRPPPKMGALPWRLCSGNTRNVLDL